MSLFMVVDIIKEREKKEKSKNSRSIYAYRVKMFDIAGLEIL